MAWKALRRYQSAPPHKGTEMTKLKDNLCTGIDKKRSDLFTISPRLLLAQAASISMAWKALRRYKYNGMRIIWLDLDGLEGPQTLQI